jgi:hypothetical protein
MARRSEFEGRMLSILDPVLDRHPLNRGRTLMSAFAALLLVVPLAALQPIRQAPQSSASVAHSDSASTSQSRAQSATSQGQNIRITDSTWKASSDGPLGKSLRNLDSASATLGRNVTALGRKVAALDTGRARVASAGAATELITGPGGEPSCDQLQPDNSTFSMHDNVDDNDAHTLRVLNNNHGHCTQAIIRGRFTTSPAEDRITTLSSGGIFSLRERDAGIDRQVTMRPAAAGSADALSIQFRLNGMDAPFDAAAQRWLAGILPGLLAEASVNVEPRVARWRAEGGTDAVLRHVAELRSSSAKRNHYEVLLAQQLPAAELQRVVVQAGGDVPSSTDLRAVLSKAAGQARTGGVAASSLEKAIGAVASSTDRTAVLQAFGQTDDREQLLAVMRVAATIPSSSDKADFMTALAPRYLGRNDAALRDAFFKTLVTIPSSTDKANVLDVAIPYAVKSADIALAVIVADTTLPSSTDKSNVLIALAERGAIRTPALRDAYLRAVQEIPSSTDMRNALEALTKH